MMEIAIRIFFFIVIVYVIGRIGYILGKTKGLSVAHGAYRKMTHSSLLWHRSCIDQHIDKDRFRHCILNVEQARYVLRNLNKERPGCGYDRMADGCRDAADLIMGTDPYRKQKT